MGTYVTNKTEGIRTHPYSTDPYVVILFIVFFVLTLWLSFQERQSFEVFQPRHPQRSSPCANSHPFSYIHDPNHYFPEIGEVWANMLHNVYASLVATYGFSSVALTNPDTQDGNVVFMHLFIDALSLQPCNPSCTLPPNRHFLSDGIDGCYSCGCP